MLSDVLSVSINPAGSRETANASVAMRLGRSINQQRQRDGRSVRLPFILCFFPHRSFAAACRVWPSFFRFPSLSALWCRRPIAILLLLVLVPDPIAEWRRGAASRPRTVASEGKILVVGTDERQDRTRAMPAHGAGDPDVRRGILVGCSAVRGYEARRRGSRGSR